MTITAAAPAPAVGLAMLDGLVGDLQAVRARIAVLQAQEAELFAHAVTVIGVREEECSGQPAAGHGSQLAVREVHAELAAGLRLSEYTVARRVNTARTLFDRFPATGDALTVGRIDPAHADAIVDAGSDLDDTRRAVFEQAALELAGTETPARLRGLLGDLVTRLDPTGTEQRVQDAASRRRVWVKDLEPGLACLGITAPTAHIHGIYDRLTQIATDLHTQNTTDAETPADAGEPADTRTIGQLRADVATDLLLTGAPTGHGTDDDDRTRLGQLRGVVHLEMPATTLTGQTAGGAILPGHGPIDTDTARTLAADAPTWTRLFRDPATGVPTCVDTYRPTQTQRRLLRARDTRCRFPGCRRPARGCDIDHTIARADGGPTALHNLAHLCRRHHTLKHDTAWTVEQLPGGILRWTSPTGRTHHDHPPGTVRFTPTPPDPPPF
jgi:hypothetical protein